MVTWTKEQEKAIYTKHKDILVAAAAGSGKTAVLVERIIQRILAEDEPIDIDNLLVVTFTRAAAQEMKNRIGHALEEAIAENPSSHHLKKQLSLLQRASISTIHSFCLDVVRQYAYLLDIDPAFRMADTMEIDLIKQDVIDELLEEQYGQEGKDLQDFLNVVERYSSDRDDTSVEELILKLHTFASQHPWPSKWLNELINMYDLPKDCKAEDIAWLSIILEDIKMHLEVIVDEISKAEEWASESDGPYHYLEAIKVDKEAALNALESADDWELLQQTVAHHSFMRLSSKRVECDEELKDKVKDLRDQYKDRWNDIKNKWFNRHLESHVNDMRELKPVMEKLVDLVKQFDQKFIDVKKEKMIASFSDLEHYCLQLLVDPSSSSPTQVAVQLKNQFKEVLIDEYQDTNLVQETILTAISDQENDGNRFMVGDVKQSIYRFRHAEPSLFITKYRRFSNNESSGEKIDLARNFRSRKEVLDGTNFIFKQIQDEQLGEINYDEDAELVYGNMSYDEVHLQHPNPEVLFIDMQDEGEQHVKLEFEEHFKDIEKIQLEARVYADKIKSWLGHGDEPPLKVIDQQTKLQRDVQYRDIVILLRAKQRIPHIMEELKKQGIPVYAELSTGYFDAIEIKIMISLLKIIDNPQQDIPLASVLRSPIVGLSDEELARIRTEKRKGSFYDSMKEYVAIQDDSLTNKLRHFLKLLNKFRLLARQGSLSELIWDIYRETGFYDFAGGMPGGRQRQANLRALYDRAGKYESTSFRGLFRFLRFIERMEEKGNDLGAARALSEQEDVVRIMSIHGSKGLEFPVVIVGEMGKQFNETDLNKKYLLDKYYGFATKYVDPEKRLMYNTLFYNAVRQVSRKAMLAEEMRVLYVALTRAKEKLVLVGTIPSIQKAKEKWQLLLSHPNWVLPTHLRSNSKTYFDWIGPALIRHRHGSSLRDDLLVEYHVLSDITDHPSSWDISIIHGSELTNKSQQTSKKKIEMAEHIKNWTSLTLDDEQLKLAVNDRLSFQYPYQEASKLRAKLSVTEIKRQFELPDEYSSDQLIKTFKPPIAKRPKFMQKEKTFTAAEKGTVMHKVMQHLPYTEMLNEIEIKQHLQKFVEREMLTSEEALIVDVPAIETFYTSEIAAYMRIAKEVYREVPFSLSILANKIYKDLPQDAKEHVLVQGVIDCLIKKDDGWIILDYKTDTIVEDVTPELKNRLQKKYETQMRLYQYAVQSIWNQPIKDTWLYFFQKQLLISVPTDKM